MADAAHAASEATGRPMLVVKQLEEFRASAGSSDHDALVIDLEHPEGAVALAEVTA